ncbi:MAG: GNAT family N-acetyltransferase [Bacteroidota bacterium]
MLIRQATADDLPAIYRLVAELAEYEKEPEALTATIEDYRKDFAAGFFEAVVAEHPVSGQITGMALYYLTYSTWKGRMLYLEDFVVESASRQLGLGQQLFDAVFERARAYECRLVKWQVLDWNEPAIAFYRKQGAIIEDNWWSCKIFT